MKIKYYCLALLVFAALSGCDSVEEEGIEGIWRADRSGDISYVDISSSTLTLYDFVDEDEGCYESRTILSLESTDGTVYTFEPSGGGGFLRVSRDGAELIITGPDEIHRASRSDVDVSDFTSC